MILFYTDDIRSDIAHLPEEEARHCVQTLRKKEGDRIQFVDGRGGFYTGSIIGTSKKSCLVAIETQQQTSARPFALHVGIAPTKNIDRFEWFLEKATEFGIETVTPLLCHHSERKNVRLDRLEKVILAAMKQSLKVHLPKLNDLTDFATFVQNDRSEQRFIAHCQDGREAHLLQAYQKGRAATVLIGPEGDFSPSEITLALQHDFRPISLGAERLRTETAGIAATHIFNLVNS